MKTYIITYTTEHTLGPRVVEIEADTAEQAICEMYELGLAGMDGSDGLEYNIEEATQ